MHCVRKTCVIGGQRYTAGQSIDLESLRPGLRGPARRFCSEVCDQDVSEETPAPPAPESEVDPPVAPPADEPGEASDVMDLLDHPIDLLNVSDRAHAVLKANEMLAVGDAVEHYREHQTFANLNGIGEKLSDEIVAAVLPLVG